MPAWPSALKNASIGPLPRDSSGTKLPRTLSTPEKCVMFAELPATASS